jgi:hypothetical protein
MSSIKTIALCLMFALAVLPARAQMVKGDQALGPSVGLYFNASNPILGANYEYFMNTNVGEGILGLGGVFRYWTWNEGVSGLGYSWEWSYTDVMIGAQGNYHFKIGTDDRLDPWAGLILAYDAGSVSYKGPSGYPFQSTPSHGGLVLGANGGMRYWFTPTIAGTARLGVGSRSFSALDIGVDFKL